MPIPEPVVALVERFQRNLETYKSPDYNEAQLRREFLDPLFQTLGWDMTNAAGYADAYKDVVHEDSIKIGGTNGGTKAPDYCFRIGGTRKFFLEAKKPSIDVKGDPSPAYQLRRYAWSAKLPISVLSDFEEFAIYDTRIKPNVNDRSSAARIFYCTYDEFAAKWDEIAAILSKDSVLKGSFDKYAETAKGKRGTAEVDDAFLAEIETWRDHLATNIALRNPKISERDLNVAVTRTIDRIVFLRICEDRGVEIYAQLQTIAKTNDIYGELLKLFRRADEKYNSGLFHFSKEPGRPEEPDTLTPSLEIDDKTLRPILNSLYYPDCPYEFSVLPSDILGHVYEQFLGKVIRLTAGHHAKVEEKPEVRKAGGVYYTPTYIVEYIVQNAVGKLVENKSPKEVAKLKILDPACGSGSFLLGAYQYLLDWHLRYYISHNPDQLLKQRQPPIYQITASSSHLTPGESGPAAPSPGYRLTTNEKKRILLNNIFGVDIDQNAVETTKLSLLLKVLENESSESLANQMKLFRERALPDLANNIKCGNSLIGPDFYENEQLSLLQDEETRYKINAFDWVNEFDLITRSGGFDAVIGNPPYVLLQDEFRDDRQLHYFRREYDAASFKVDTYHLFIERGILLLKHAARFGFITPSNYLTNNHLDSLRRFIIDHCRIDHINIVEGGVFPGVSVDTAISIFVRAPAEDNTFDIIRSSTDGESLAEVRRTSVRTTNVRQNDGFLFTGTTSAPHRSLWKRTESISAELGALAFVNFGKQLRDRKKYLKDVIEVPDVRKVPRGYRTCLTGRDINRYALSWGNLACLQDDIAQSGGCWDPSMHQAKDKLLSRQIGRAPSFALDTTGYDCLNTIFMVKLRTQTYSPLYLLGVLNSRFMQAYWLDKFYDQRRTFPKIKGTYLKLLPIRSLDLSRSADKSKHDCIVQAVRSMLSLHHQLAKAKSGREQIQRQIAATDKQIDALVYQLYNLSPDEIQLVEAATRAP